MSVIQLNTYAKINLSLDVTGVRKDGYHEVSMVMQAVDLSDTLTVEVKHADENRVFLTSDSPDLPLDERNTAYRAAQSMLELSEMPERKQMKVRKTISDWRFTSILKRKYRKLPDWQGEVPMPPASFWHSISFWG